MSPEANLGAAGEPAVGGASVLVPEQFSMTLSLGGRAAGEQSWQLQVERAALTTRVQTDFGGVLPELRRVQQIRMSLATLESLAYQEGDGRGRANFETVFDRERGLMTLRQGRDEAVAPLTTEHHDPLSLVLWLRTFSDEQQRAAAWLTGGRALVQRLPDLDIGDEPCAAYFLRPGNAYVYVGRSAARPLVRLIQPTDFGPIEANLVRPGARRTPDRSRRRRAS